jgi:hypothetical protein
MEPTGTGQVNVTCPVGSTLSWSVEFKHRNISANAVHVCGDWQHLKGHWVKGERQSCYQAAILENQLRAITSELMAGSAPNFNHRCIYLVRIFYGFFTRGEHNGPGHFIFYWTTLQIVVITFSQGSLWTQPQIFPCQKCKAMQCTSWKCADIQRLPANGVLLVSLLCRLRPPTPSEVKPTKILASSLQSKALAQDIIRT